MTQCAACHPSASDCVEFVETFSSVSYSCTPTPNDTIKVTGYHYGWTNHFFSVDRERELVLRIGDRLAAIGGVLSAI